MVKKNKPAKGQDLEQAEIWFSRTDDRIPFEAFSSRQEKTAIGEEILGTIRRKIKTQKLYRLWRNVAAAAVILITAGTFSYRAYEATRPSMVKQTWVSYVANKGEFKEIQLPDSSIIHLRPGTKIAIAHPFIQQTRQVKLLEGEVYFEVSHDQSHPFLVNTSQLTTEVLGTKFIVQNDPFATAIKVTLLSGKVAVRTAKAQLGVLSPNQQLTFNRLNETVKLESSASNLAENWLKGEYLLEDVSLKSFAKTFGNAFLMEVKFKQKALEDLPISIQFNRADQPKAILEQLKLIHGLHYQIKDKEVLLMK